MGSCCLTKLANICTFSYQVFFSTSAEHLCMPSVFSFNLQHFSPQLSSQCMNLLPVSLRKWKQLEEHFYETSPSILVLVVIPKHRNFSPAVCSPATVSHLLLPKGMALVFYSIFVIFLKKFSSDNPISIQTWYSPPILLLSHFSFLSQQNFLGLLSLLPLPHFSLIVSFDSLPLSLPGVTKP